MDINRTRVRVCHIQGQMGRVLLAQNGETNRTIAGVDAPSFSLFIKINNDFVRAQMYCLVFRSKISHSRPRSPFPYGRRRPPRSTAVQFSSSGMVYLLTHSQADGTPSPHVRRSKEVAHISSRPRTRFHPVRHFMGYLFTP